MKAYKTLVRNVIANGDLISVYDGEEWAVKMSSSAKEIYAAIESVGEAELIISGKDKSKKGWALVMPYGLADDETVVNFSDNDYMLEMVEI